MTDESKEKNNAIREHDKTTSLKYHSNKGLRNVESGMNMVNGIFSMASTGIGVYKHNKAEKERDKEIAYNTNQRDIADYVTTRLYGNASKQIPGAYGKVMSNPDTTKTLEDANSEWNAIFNAKDVSERFQCDIEVAEDILGKLEQRMRPDWDDAVAYMNVAKEQKKAELSFGTKAADVTSNPDLDYGLIDVNQGIEGTTSALPATPATGTTTPQPVVDTEEQVIVDENGGPISVPTDVTAMPETSEVEPVIATPTIPQYDTTQQTITNNLVSMVQDLQKEYNGRRNLPDGTFAFDENGDLDPSKAQPALAYMAGKVDAIVSNITDTTFDKWIMEDNLTLPDITEKINQSVDAAVEKLGFSGQDGVPSMVSEISTSVQAKIGNKMNARWNKLDNDSLEKARNVENDMNAILNTKGTIGREEIDNLFAKYEMNPTNRFDANRMKVLLSNANQTALAYRSEWLDKTVERLGGEQAIKEMLLDDEKGGEGKYKLTGDMMVLDKPAEEKTPLNNSVDKLWHEVVTDSKASSSYVSTLHTDMIDRIAEEDGGWNDNEKALFASYVGQLDVDIIREYGEGLDKDALRIVTDMTMDTKTKQSSIRKLFVHDPTSRDKWLKTIDNGTAELMGSVVNRIELLLYSSEGGYEFSKEEANYIKSRIADNKDFLAKLESFVFGVNREITDVDIESIATSSIEVFTKEDAVDTILANQTNIFKDIMPELFTIKRQGEYENTDIKTLKDLELSGRLSLVTNADAVSLAETAIDKAIVDSREKGKKIKSVPDDVYNQASVARFGKPFNKLGDMDKELVEVDVALALANQVRWHNIRDNFGEVFPDLQSVNVYGYDRGAITADGVLILVNNGSYTVANEDFLIVQIPDKAKVKALRDGSIPAIDSSSFGKQAPYSMSYQYKYGNNDVEKGSEYRGHGDWLKIPVEKDEAFFQALGGLSIHGYGMTVHAKEDI